MHEILPHLFCKLFYELALEWSLECESRGANYFPRSKNINLYNKYFLALFLQTKDPSVSPSNDGKGLIPGWYALNVCLVGPYIALASI